MADEVLEILFNLLEGLDLFSKFSSKTIKRIAKFILVLSLFIVTVLLILLLMWLK